MQWVELEYFINSPDGCLFCKLKMKQLSKLWRLLNSLLSSDEIVPKVSFDDSMCNVGAHSHTKTCTETSPKKVRQFADWYRKLQPQRVETPFEPKKF